MIANACSTLGSLLGSSPTGSGVVSDTVALAGLVSTSSLKKSRDKFEDQF